MKSYDLGFFLKGAGNGVFYSLGVVSCLREKGISPDLIAGFSSSSAVIFEEIIGCYDEGRSIFKEKISENKKNFYFFRKEHFPHDRIYRSTVSKIVSKYNPEKRLMDWRIVAVLTSKRFTTLKRIFSLIGLKLGEILPKSLILKILAAKSIYLNSWDNPNNSEIENMIMGSSSLYPAIKTYHHKDKLILDGGLHNFEHKDILNNSKKGLIISPFERSVKERNNYLYVGPEKKIEIHLLDYNTAENIDDLFQRGLEDGEKYFEKIKEYVSSEIE
jgi:predicted acylesterase/phospholipase RssA